MQENELVCYFLGANSPRGFVSLYDQLIDPAEARAIYILKGGPGGGTSSLLRRVARRAGEAGERVERILCPAGPDALDAVLLPERRVALIDGTPPHVVEPVYPGVVEHYVNLEACYDRAGLQGVRREIMDCAAGARDGNWRALRCLGAAAEIAEDVRAILTTDALEEKAARRAGGILSREARPPERGSGRVAQRFLGAFTYRGAVRCDETVCTLCRRVYALEDPDGLAHPLLARLLSGFTAAGCDVVACPSPLAPDRLEHLLVPGLSLAFLSVSPGQPWEKRPFRRVRVDAMPGAELLRRNRARLRFSRRVSAAFLDEAAGALAQVREVRGQLEELYRPHVDFARIARTADALAGEILRAV